MMSERDHEAVRRRNTITSQERRDRFGATHDTAMATIASETDARKKRQNGFELHARLSRQSDAPLPHRALRDANSFWTDFFKASIILTTLLCFSSGDFFDLDVAFFAGL